MDAGSTVRSCASSANYRGIIARGGSYLIDNICYLNESNGIEVNDANGHANRVDGNSCSRNKGSSFLVQIGFGNLVIRNNADHNGYGSNRPESEANYHLPGAAAGPIVKVTSNVTIDEISPWANFSY